LLFIKNGIFCDNTTFKITGVFFDRISIDGEIIGDTDASHLDLITEHQYELSRDDYDTPLYDIAGSDNSTIAFHKGDNYIEFGTDLKLDVCENTFVSNLIKEFENYSFTKGNLLVYIDEEDSEKPTTEGKIIVPTKTYDNKCLYGYVVGAPESSEYAVGDKILVSKDVTLFPAIFTKEDRKLFVIDDIKVLAIVN
jgi:hypothetical protein